MRFITVFIASVCFVSNAFAEPENPACVDISSSLASNISEAAILDNLVSTNCGLQLNTAVYSILGAGGDQVKTLVAALLIDPKYTYIDPTTELPPTSAGAGSNSEPSNDSKSTQSTTSSGGGASPS